MIVRIRKGLALPRHDDPRRFVGLRPANPGDVVVLQVAGGPAYAFERDGGLADVPDLRYYRRAIRRGDLEVADEKKPAAPAVERKPAP